MLQIRLGLIHDDMAMKRGVRVKAKRRIPPRDYPPRIERIVYAISPKDLRDVRQFDISCKARISLLNWKQVPILPRWLPLINKKSKERILLTRQVNQISQPS